MENREKINKCFRHSRLGVQCCVDCAEYEECWDYWPNKHETIKMHKTFLMCESLEGAAASRAAQKQPVDWYNETTPDSRYELPYVNTKHQSFHPIPLIESRWNRC